MAGPLSRTAFAPRRRLAFAALCAGVLALHAWFVTALRDRLGDIASRAAMPARIEVAYVRELEPAAPPAVARPAVPKPRVRRAAPPLPPASAPEPEASESEPPASELAPAWQEPPPAPEPAAEAPAVAAAEPASAPASASEPFAWPTATRLTYKLSGNVRGEVHGDAQVEWIRQGERYQVHLDVTVGLPIAPLISRRMSSDGELTEQGLSPRRYDEDTRLMFRAPRRVTLRFEPDAIVMPDGRRLRRQQGVQDTASQFVQLSWLFTTKPGLLRPGNTIDLALALPKSVDRWVYDVLGEETVATSFGAVDAFHLKPRRVSRPGGDLVAEIWFAPTLRYLPARIRIEQDSETFIDLVLARKPELAP